MDEHFHTQFTAKQKGMLKFAQDMPVSANVGPPAPGQDQTRAKEVLPTAAQVMRGAPDHTREVPTAGRGVDVQYTTRPLGPAAVTRETAVPSPARETVTRDQSGACGRCAPSGVAESNIQVANTVDNAPGAGRSDVSQAIPTVTSAVTTWAATVDARLPNQGNRQVHTMQQILAENPTAVSRPMLPPQYPANMYNGNFAPPSMYSQTPFPHISPVYYDPNMQAAINPCFYRSQPTQFVPAYNANTDQVYHQ